MTTTRFLSITHYTLFNHLQSWLLFETSSKQDQHFVTAVTGKNKTKHETGKKANKPQHNHAFMPQEIREKMRTSNTVYS